MGKSMSTIQSTEEPVKHGHTAALATQSTEENATWKDFVAVSKTGIVFSNLITAFAGFWLALYFTNIPFSSHFSTLVFAMIGTTLIVTGGCALNNYIDRDIDPIMERTKDRPTATGKLGPRHVLWYGLILSVLGTIFLLFANYTTAVLGLLGLFVYVFVYTIWLKRSHSISTVVGSISGALPPVIGWTAVDPNPGWLAFVLFLIMFLWQPPHFLALAMKRVDEYRAAGIPMLPVVAGFAFTKRQMLVYVISVTGASLFLYPLGAFYMTVALLLGAGWIVLAFRGKYAKDDRAWAKSMFVYSLNYLTILFGVMVIATLF